MAISYSVTVVFHAASKHMLTSYIYNQATLENLGPLYPTLNLTESDMSLIVTELYDEHKIEYQQRSNPFLLTLTIEPYDGPLGVGTTVTRVYSDIAGYELTRSQFSPLRDHRLYTLDGINLVRVSDGGIEAVLTPKEYVLWKWIFYAQQVVTRGEPIEI